MERAPFSIREFSVELRKEIVAEAEANKQSVGDFVEAVCLAARAAGWLRVTPDQGQNGPDQAKMVLFDRLSNSQLIEIAGNPSFPRWLRAGVVKRIARLVDVPIPHGAPQKKLLEGPNDAPRASQSPAPAAAVPSK